MKKCLLYFPMLLLLACHQPKSLKEDNSLLTYVNPFIGTSNGGNQQPGARLPFGSVHFSPVNVSEFEPLASNYGFSKQEIFGFSLVNMSGVGCPNYGGVLLMPFDTMPDMKNKGASYTNEIASPGYSSVEFKDKSIRTELSSTMRCAIARFTFLEASAFLTLDLSRRHKEDTSFFIQKLSDTEVGGYKKDGVFCGSKGSHTIYFYTKLRQKPSKSGLLRKGEITSEDQLLGEDIAFFAQYNNSGQNQYEVVSGISYVSIKNAKENLEAEVGNVSFEEIRRRAAIAWNEKLSRVKVEGHNEDDKTKFYTALYHTMSHPNIINDVNGEYPSMNSFKTKVSKPGHNRYSLYSLWDTYRNLHSLFALVYPEIQSDMVQSMVDMYKENGWLPHWELISTEKGVMNGDPASIVIVDSYLRGIKDFDIETAYKAMLNNAENSYATPGRDNNREEFVRDGIKHYLKNKGYIPHNFAEEVWGCVATTMEYNLSDWNIAQMAKALSNMEDYKKFTERSVGYRYFWDNSTAFFRPRYADGSYLEPFDPLENSGAKAWDLSGGPGYCEGNAWNYLYFVPHDIEFVRDKIMGKKLFISKLQQMFDSGYYSAENEPDIAFPYLFNYVQGEEWRTQKQVRKIIEEEYGIGHNGIPGNDDTGTMSSWLIFSSLGLYPDCPGNMKYQITSPLFDKVTIKLNPQYYKGEEFVITSTKMSDNSMYIKNVSLNGKTFNSYAINHSILVKGGNLHFNLVDSTVLNSKPIIRN